MSTKHFCDICDKLATGMPKMPWIVKDKFYLQAQVFRSADYTKRSTDKEADVCISCLAKAVRELADKLERECNG